MGERKEKEKKKEKEKEKGDLPRERLTTSNARKDKYERRNMNENDFSAAFDAEDAFASRMDYMRRRRRRRRRRREVEKEEKEEEEKVRRQRASEPRRICFVLDGTQKITRNSRSHLGQGLVKYCSRFETFARSANASLEKSHETRKPAKQVGLPIQKRREYEGMGWVRV